VLIIRVPHESPRLLRLDLVTNQLSAFETTFQPNDYRRIEPLAWHGQTLYVLFHDQPNGSATLQPVLAKLTLNQQAKIEILAELADWPDYWVSANQQALVYRQSQTATEQTLVWWNLTDQTSRTLTLPLVSHAALALAPDGSALAMVTLDPTQQVAELRRYDYASQTWQTLDQQASGQIVTTNPVVGWSADSQHLWWQRSLPQPLLAKEYRVYTATGALQSTDELPLHHQAVVSADAETLVLVGVAGTMLQERQHGRITAQFPLPVDLLEQKVLAGVNR